MSGGRRIGSGQRQPHSGKGQRRHGGRGHNTDEPRFPRLSLKGALQMSHRLIAVAGVGHGAAADDTAQLSGGQLPHGGVAARPHDVEHNAQSVNIRPGIRLGDAELLRGGKAHGAQYLSVGGGTRLEEAGGVKIHQHGAAVPEDHIIRLDVPVDDVLLVEEG